MGAVNDIYNCMFMQFVEETQTHWAFKTIHTQFKGLSQYLGAPT